ncbi:VOC family protein [Hymenobacter sp. B81]|uniref:VOC family protein n=1 Tax=Hymenobacter sp. B81 TaxID=3344878 RepID=UPI0037DC2F21
MATNIFVNLPVQDLNASVAFFTQLGFRFNQQFTDENAACMVVSDTIYVMLLVKPFFQNFTDKQLADARTSTEVIVCLSADSREEVDRLADAALAAGARPSKPLQEHECMHARNFQDLDGHLWEVMYMDMSAVPQPEPAAASAE